MITSISIAAVLLAAICAIHAWRLTRDERARSAARVAALAAAIQGTRGDAPAEMFGRDPHSVVQGRPLLKVAIGFGMAVAIIVLIAMSGDRPRTSTTATAVARASDGAAPAAEALELVSMRHERAGDTLTVTGLVRNPGAEAPGALAAVVFAFDRDGHFVASGRAPLEFATIAAGDESPFRVTVPDVKDVGRYRVSFRTDAGVVRHVDRRPAIAAAATAPASIATN